MSIHPTALVDPHAQIAADVVIGPFCVLGPHVVLHAGVVLHSHVVITGHTVIGAGTHVFPFACLGQPPQDLKFQGETARLEIGEQNQIREYVTMHVGTAADRGVTRVGNHNLVMGLVHVAHDCDIGNHCILANGATLAGHVTLADRVRIGGLSAIAQFVRLGEGAFVDGHVGVERDVPPFAKVSGNNGSVAGLNVVGLRRAGLNNQTIRDLNGIFQDLFSPLRDRPLAEVAQELSERELDPQQRILVDFVLAGPRKREA